MRVNKGLFAILPIFLLGVLLLSSFASAVWPFTGNAVESGSRPTITSTSPSDDTIRIGAHQLISASFSASDPDADMNNLWMQVWKQKSTSDLDDFFTPASGYNNPSGFYTGSPQGTTTASSNTFTFSLATAGTYYLRFAVRDVASTTLTEEWKTIIVGEKGSVCGANNQCMAGLECKSQICNEPGSATHVANVCQSCNATTQCGTGMFCETFYHDVGVCKYNKGNVGEGCWLVPEGAPVSADYKCSTGTYLKPCAAGLTCIYSQAWHTTFGFLGTQGTCQQLNVSLGGSCGANILCASGLKCDSGTSKCIIENAQKPRLFSLTYSSTSVSQGTSIDYYIEAKKGSADLTRHRLYVEGSQGGVWTNLTGSSRNEAVLDTTISTEANPRSFYRGPGEYYLVYEVEDAYGLTSSSRTKVVLRPAAGVELPRVLEFDVTSSSRVNEGTPLSVYAKAKAGTYPLFNHRLYVAGSNGGKGSQWTPIDSSSSEVTVNTTIPTSRNPLSFYRGPGKYTLIYEINDTSGAITSSTYDVEIVEASVADSIDEYSAGDSILLSEGENIKVNIAGKARAVSLAFISSASIRLMIDGVTTEPIAQGASFSTIDGKNILVKVYSIAFNPTQGGQGSARFAMYDLAQGIDFFSVKGEHCSSTIECKTGLVCDSQLSTCVKPVNGLCENNQQCGSAQSCDAGVCKKILNAVCNYALPSECRVGLICKIGYNGVTMMCSTPSATEQNNTDAPTAGTYPIINYLEISATQVVQGQNLLVSASATAVNGTTINRHRITVDSMDGRLTGANWTMAEAGATQVSVGPSYPIPTATNPLSFSKGIGEYVVRYEVEDSSARVSSTERKVTILSPTSVTTTSQGSTGPATATNAPSNSGTADSQGSSAAQCSNGCLALNLQTCYQVGYRFDGKFCDGTSKTVTQQRVAGLSCNNGFECSSNVCAANQCVDAGVFARLLAWFEANF